MVMPSLLSNFASERVSLETDAESPLKPPHSSTKQSLAHPMTNFKAKLPNGSTPTAPFANGHLNGAPPDEANATTLGNVPFTNGTSGLEGDRPSGKLSLDGNRKAIETGNTDPVRESARHNGQPTRAVKRDSVDGASTGGSPTIAQSPVRKSLDAPQAARGWHKGHSRAHSSSAPQNVNPTFLDSIQGSPPTSSDMSTPIGLSSHSTSKMLSSSLPAPSSPLEPNPELSATSLHPVAPRLHHRHTLEVPRVSTSRTSRDFSYPNTASDGYSDSGRFTPTPRTPRASNTLARAPTRSIHSDMFLDEIPPDTDMARWTETIRQKRASRRKRKEGDEEDDRVVVGTKVDMNHVNWVTAYNMLTGIRFTVSRTNAKMDRELGDSDFMAKHKFSFDITGNELTPSAKYDFKFKDYAPWVFRHLRAKFQIDPADYLMSLTSKYILSELGSPGKSGSFFYFSRDYKYIIKTIHHAEHKLLRKVLRDYYSHVENNPNTLISQFYGLHRVKIPYGRKIHFVVMNNLFPPHRDIHQTFDLKGSTIGRDFREEDLERNPRATLKDLNWLRRNYHFEFGPQKKTLFVEQMKRDVALLQKLKIMDYSLLVGIHDLGKGNEENLRDKTLQIFQPGGDDETEPQVKMLTRTPSKLENARQAKHLRQIIKRERPVPIDKSTSKMPEEMLEGRKNFIFYSNDGGFRATHEDGQPGEEIYYLGIIDCLTHVSICECYGLRKRC